MGFSYLGGHNWGEIARDERHFCCELYMHYKNEPNNFVQFLLNCATMQGNVLSEKDLECEWELGFEVCFYRDLGWYLVRDGKLPIDLTAFSRKRTFDLCLFSEEKILIIEAKVQQPFDSVQMLNFEKDVESITRLLTAAAYKVPQVYVLGLASKTYFSNARKFAKEGIPSLFADNHFTWIDLYNATGVVAFKKAEERYKK